MATHATTALGKSLRKLRVDHDERMGDMAGKLGVSASYLSAVEHGRKNPPLGLADDVVDLYGLGAEKAQEITAAAADSRCAGARRATKRRSAV